jgi:hypothetical protein
MGSDDEPWWGGSMTCDGEEGALFAYKVLLERLP